MNPLRKDENFDNRFQDEKSFKKEQPQPDEIAESAEMERARSAEFERGQPDAEYPPNVAYSDAAYPGKAFSEPKKPERMSMPMGPVLATVPKSETPETKAGGPQLVSKEPKAGEPKKARFFAENELQQMRTRWDKIQGEFVDQPRQAVEDADNLIGEAIKKLSEQFAEERSGVIREWNSGDNVSTEVLRQSLRRYRTFFDRLLAA